MVENEVTKRLTGAALAALLLFFACVPVPTNLQAWDRVRYQKAYAGAEIAVLGGTPGMLLTLMGMAGVYVACHSDGEWLENSAAVASDFAQFVNENGYVNEYNCDISQYVDETGQNIDVQAAYDGGFYDMLQAYLASEGVSQTFENGNSSAAGTQKSSFVYNGVNYPAASEFPYAQYMTETTSEMLSQGKVLVGYAYEGTLASGYRLGYTYYYAELPVAFETNYTQAAGNTLKSIEVLTGKSFQVVKSDGSLYSIGSGTVNGRLTVYETYSSRYFLNAGVPIVVNGNEVSATSGYTHAGVFDPATVSSRIGEIANGAVSKVRVFEPTAEQLEAGYDYQTILQNELAGINTGIEGLDNILNSILSVVAPLAGLVTAPFSWMQSWWNTLSGWWAELLAWVRATPLGQFCSTVTEWMGSTPFGNIAATVIDGVQAIPGAVARAGQAVLEGVQAIPGAISGTLEGIREGVLSLPLSIADVVAAVQAGVVDLTGALESVTGMKLTPSGNGLHVSDEVKLRLDAMLDAKAPFCYLRRAQATAASVAGNFTSNADFYIDVDIPFAGTQRFDAGEILNRQWGSLTVAQYIRMLFTASLCAGLLAVSVRIATGSIKGKE